MKKRKTRKKRPLITCPECNGQGAFLAGHNSSDSINCVTCAGEGKIAAPKINIEMG